MPLSPESQHQMDRTSFHGRIPDSESNPYRSRLSMVRKACREKEASIDPALDPALDPVTAFKIKMLQAYPQLKPTFEQIRASNEKHVDDSCVVPHTHNVPVNEARFGFRSH